MYEKLITEFRKLHQPIYTVWCDYLSEYELDDDADEDLYLLDLELHEDISFNVFNYWMGEDKYRKQEVDLSQHFATFGENGDGSLIAIWLSKGKKVLECPVVVIGSEGELGIVAPDYLTFLQLSAMGCGMYDLMDWQPTEAQDSFLPMIDFLNYIKTTFKRSSIDKSEVGLILEKARAGSPNLEEMVEDFFK